MRFISLFAINAFVYFQTVRYLSSVCLAVEWMGEGEQSPRRIMECYIRKKKEKRVCAWIKASEGRYEGLMRMYVYYDSVGRIALRF